MTPTLKVLALLAASAIASGCTGDYGPPIGGEPPTTTTTLMVTTTLPGSVEGRNLANRPDETSQARAKALYVVPLDGDDQLLDVNGRIEMSVRATQNWLSDASGVQLRMDQFEGALDIGFVRLDETSSQVASAGALETMAGAVEEAGFDDPNTTYLMFYEGSVAGACGSAWRPGRHAGVYLQTPNCGEIGRSESDPSWIDYTGIHELFHSAGVVGNCAPNASTPGHVGDDPADLMYSGPASRPMPRVLDIGAEDYWAHSNAGCVDMAQSALVDHPFAGLTDTPAQRAPVVRGPEVIDVAPPG